MRWSLPESAPAKTLPLTWARSGPCVVVKRAVRVLSGRRALRRVESAVGAVFVSEGVVVPVGAVLVVAVLVEAVLVEGVPFKPG
jgi:hypothetical protein